MARTSWRDLVADGERAGDSASASPAASAPRPSAETPAAAFDGAPSSLGDVPQLAALLEERRRLEQQLRALTGGGNEAPTDARDARRFPVLSSATRPRLGLRERDVDAERDDARRSLDVDDSSGRRQDRREQARRDELQDRAARRRREGAARVERAAAAWDRHRDGLLQARELARNAALQGRALGLPGADVAANVLRRAEALVSGLDTLVTRGSGARDEAEQRATARPRDTWAELRDGARALARGVQDALERSDAGRRLRSLQEELSPPPLRELPDYTGEGDVDVLEQRRQRALEALRERRALEPPERAPSRRAPAEDRP